MPLPSNNKQVGDIGHADDHNAIVNEIISTASAIGQRLLASTASTLYLGINNTAQHARTASSISGLLITGPVASSNFALFALSASSISWSLVTNRPSASPALNPQIGVILTGNTTGAASVTLTSLNNGQLSITTNTAFAQSASSIAGSLVTGTVNNASQANTASSINWAGVTGRPTTGSGYGITDLAPLNSPNFSGIPTVPTASPGNSSTQIASTQWVNSAILSINSGSFVDLSNYLQKDSASITYLGINNTAQHARTASSIFGLLVTGPVASANFSLFANSASSMNWSQVTSRPSASPSLNPQIGVSLTGPVTGNASAVFNSLSNAQVTITTQQNITINPQTVSSYTLQLSDVSKLITMNNASENAIVIPLESSVNFPIGSQIDIVQIGSGTSSVTFVNGVTLNSDTSKKTINAQYAAASLVKLESDSWLLIGALK